MHVVLYLNALVGVAIGKTFLFLCRKESSSIKNFSNIILPKQINSQKTTWVNFENINISRKSVSKTFDINKLEKMKKIIKLHMNG